MNFEILNTEIPPSSSPTNTQSLSSGVMEGRSSSPTNTQSLSSGVMEGRVSAGVQKRKEYKKSSVSSYFSLESLLVLICLTASLLILPLILPPLPPPPIMLLLVPVGILIVLLMLAFIPSDIRDIASSYL